MHRAHDRHGPIIDGHVYDLKNPNRTGAPQPRHNPFHPAGRIGKPFTLIELQRRTGPYFGKAKVHAEWSAISTWMMKGDAAPAFDAAGIPHDVARVAVQLVHAAKNHAKGWPSLSGKIETPLLYGLSPDCRQEAKRTAYEVYQVWQEKGRPFLSAKLIEQTYQHLVAAIRAGLLPSIREIPADQSQAHSLRAPFCPVDNLKF